jgi:alcohol sulfotransferase
MISRYFQSTHQHIPDGIILGFDNFHKLNPRVPKIFFTHDNYLRRYTGNEDSRKDFYDCKVVLLVRKPQDVAVSQFFQWKHRMKPYKKALNNYPEHNSDISIYDFVMHPGQGLPRILQVQNEWLAELTRIKNLHVVRYEDLRTSPERELTRLMEFLGEDVDPGVVEETVAFASVENLRKMESENYFWRSGSRVQAPDTSNPDSYKVRKAKVGGYRDYFDDAQLALIDAYVDEHLDTGFGYTTDEATQDPAPAASGVTPTTAGEGVSAS